MNNDNGPLFTRRALLASLATGASAMLTSPTAAFAWSGPFDAAPNPLDSFVDWNNSYNGSIWYDFSTAWNWESQCSLCNDWQDLWHESGESGHYYWAYTQTPWASSCMGPATCSNRDWLAASLKMVARCDFATPLYFHVTVDPLVAASSLMGRRSAGWQYNPDNDSSYTLELKFPDENSGTQVINSESFDLRTDYDAEAAGLLVHHSGYDDQRDYWWTDYMKWDPNAGWNFWVRRGYSHRLFNMRMTGSYWNFWHYGYYNATVYFPSKWLTAGAAQEWVTWSGGTKPLAGVVFENRIFNLAVPADELQCAYVGDGKHSSLNEQVPELWPAPEQLNLQWVGCPTSGSCSNASQHSNTNRWENTIALANAMQVAGGYDALWLDQRGAGPTTEPCVQAQVYTGNGSAAQAFWIAVNDDDKTTFNIISDCSGHYLNRLNDKETTGTRLQFYHGGCDNEQHNRGSRWKLIDCWHMRQVGNQRGSDGAAYEFLLKSENLALASSDEKTDRRTATWSPKSPDADKAQLAIPTISSCTYPYSWAGSSLLPNSNYSIVWHEVMKKPDGSFYDPAYLNGKIAVWCRSYHGSEYGRLAAEQPTQNCAGMPGRHRLHSFRLRLQNETGLSGSLVYQKANATEELPDIDDWDNPLAADTAALTTAEGAGYESDASSTSCIRCKLTGELAEAFDVTYHCYIGANVQNWTSWEANGEWTERIADAPVDAIGIRIEPKWYKEADITGFRPLSSSSTQKTLMIKDAAPTKGNPRAFVLCTALDLPNSYYHQKHVGCDLRYLGHAASEMIVVEAEDADGGEDSTNYRCTVRFFADGETNPKYSSDELVSDGSRYSFPDAAATACAKTGCRLDKWYSDPDYTKEITYVTLPKDEDGTIDVYTRNICTVAFDLTNSTKKHLASNTPYADEAMTSPADLALMKPADMDAVYWGTRLYPSMCSWAGRLMEAYIEAGASATAHKITVRDGFYTDPAATSAFSSQGITIVGSTTLYVDWPRATFDGYEAS